MLRARHLKGRLLGGLRAVGVSLPAAPHAAAVSLTQVTNFGTNPTLQMYLYVPNGVKANPSIQLAPYGCQGSGPYLYARTDFGSLADQYGFIAIYPVSAKAIVWSCSGGTNQQWTLR